MIPNKASQQCAACNKNSDEYDDADDPQNIQPDLGDQTLLVQAFLQTFTLICLLTVIHNNLL